MTFVHPLLLGGLLLAGVPVLLHLIMQQRPKRLPFPAFRFLLQKHRSNQRTLRLRHLLLLLLRMAVIAALCLALARPKLGERPVAVLVLDTSPGMGYKAAGKTRLDEAKRHALEVLDALPPDSQVAVLDSAEESAAGWVSPGEARERVAALRLNPAATPVTSRLDEAYRLLADLPDGPDGSAEETQRQLYVFSDRTQNGWDGRRLKQLQAQRDRLPAGKTRAFFVDVGAERPENLAVADLKLARAAVAANDKVEIQTTVRATGRDYDTEVVCKIDGDNGERRAVQLKAGQSEVYTWERGGLAPGPHFVEVRLASEDEHLGFTNVRYAAFEVGAAREVLVITDDPRPPIPWVAALEAGRVYRFACTVLPTAKATDLGPEQLDRYQAVCLLSVANPQPALWQLLERYVAKGGGLAVLPGGEETRVSAYQTAEGGSNLLPGKLVRPVRAEPGAVWDWDSADYRNPLLKPFAGYRANPNTDFFRLSPRHAERYWEVAAVPEAEILVRYADPDKRPALLETHFDRAKVRGRVVLATTPLDARTPRWNNYLESITSFYTVLAKLLVDYLGGGVEEAGNNQTLTAQTLQQGVKVPLPLAPRFANYTLYRADRPHGADFLGTTFVAALPRAPGDNELRVTQAVEPGTYTLLGSGEGKSWLGGFSLNLPVEEADLTRVPAEAVEELLGPGSVLPGGRGLSPGGGWGRTVVELAPWLMIVVLIVLAVENLLANKFYRKVGVDEGGRARPVKAPEKRAAQTVGGEAR